LQIILMIVVVLAVIFLIVYNSNLASKRKKEQPALQQSQDRDQVMTDLSETEPVQVKEGIAEVSEVHTPNDSMIRDQEYRQALRKMLGNEEEPKQEEMLEQQEEKKPTLLRDEDYRAALRTMKDKK
jgi:hypothetical protein